MDASQLGMMFDCDGTLLDSADMWHELENSLVRKSGAMLTPADREYLHECTIPECGAFFHERFGLAGSGEEVVEIMDDFAIEYYSRRAVARPGALAFVAALAERGAHLAVTSSSPQEYLIAGMEHCGFAPYLQEIVSVNDVGKSKREPAVWIHACELLGTPRESTWGVEDSTYAVRTLSGAGFPTLGVYDRDRSGTWDELSKEATRAIRSFEDIDADTFLAWADAAIAR